MTEEELETLFDDIIRRALAEAAAVECSATTYRVGLLGWIEEIRMEIEASREGGPSS